MATRFSPGDDVQTPHGKGVVREVRNNGRLLVQVQQRALIVAESAVSTAKARRRVALVPQVETPGATRKPAAGEIDLHGLRVEEALTRIDEALDEALRAGHDEVRFIHGRSGGRLREALHARLREVATVRGFSLDSRNPGVTIVVL